MATRGHSICPILGGQALSTGSTGNDSQFTLGHMSSWVLTLVELEELAWGAGDRPAASESGEGWGGQLEPRGEAHLLLSPDAPTLQRTKCRLRDIDSRAQGHTAREPPGHGQRLFPPRRFPGSEGARARAAAQ